MENVNKAERIAALKSLTFPRYFTVIEISNAFSRIHKIFRVKQTGVTLACHAARKTLFDKQMKEYEWVQNNEVNLEMAYPVLNKIRASEALDFGSFRVDAYSEVYVFGQRNQFYNVPVDDYKKIFLEIVRYADENELYPFN